MENNFFVLEKIISFQPTSKKVTCLEPLELSEFINHSSFCTLNSTNASDLIWSDKAKYMFLNF